MAETRVIVKRGVQMLVAGGVLASALGGQSQVKKDPMVQTSVLSPVKIDGRLSKVGPMARNLWPFNMLDVWDQKLGRDVFYITSFNSTGGQLIRLDYQRNQAKSWKMPAGIGSWGIIQGRDGDLYMGSYNEGKLMRFDPRREVWVDMPQASEEFRKKESIICTLAQAPDGSIYYGTYPGAHLVRYDPRTKTVTDLGRAGDENYLRHLVVTPSGMVIARIGTHDPRTVVYNPQTKQFTRLTPKQYTAIGVMPSPILTDKYLVEPMSDCLLLYDVKTLRFLRAVPLGNKGEDAKYFVKIDDHHVVFAAGATLNSVDLDTGKVELYSKQDREIVGNWHLTGDGRLIALRVQSYFLLDAKSGKLEMRMIPAEGLGQDLLWLRSTPEGMVYGGPGLGQTMFSYDTQRRLLHSYGQVVDVGGEIYYGVPLDGQLYTISYIEGTLAVFNPKRAWNQGSDADSNPRTIMHMPEQQYRPVGGIHTGPGGKLYIGTQPDYGLLGGALSVFDPKTGKIEVHRNLVQDEEISAVATDDRLVYAESDRGGGGGSKPTATGVHFLAWNPATKKIVFDHVFPDAGIFEAIAAVGGHAYFITMGHLWDYDRASDTLTAVLDFKGNPRVPLESLQAAADGTLWAILDKSLVHLMPKEKKYEVIADTEGHASSGLTIGKDGTIFFGSTLDMWMYRPEKPSPPLSYGQ